MTITVIPTQPDSTTAPVASRSTGASDSLHDVDTVDLHDTVVRHRDATWCEWPTHACPNDPFGTSCDVSTEVIELSSRGIDL